MGGLDWGGAGFCGSGVVDACMHTSIHTSIYSILFYSILSLHPSIHPSILQYSIYIPRSADVPRVGFIELPFGSGTALFCFAVVCGLGLRKRRMKQGFLDWDWDWMGLISYVFENGDTTMTAMANVGECVCVWLVEGVFGCC